MFDQTRTVGARVTGPAHIREGKGCDDAFAWRQFGDAVQVLAVADGAGSVSGTSAWGSWAATQFVTQDDVARSVVADLQRAENWEEAQKILRLLFLGALRHVAYHASRLGIPLRSMNTTLAVAVVTPLRSWVAEIGDGIVAVLDSDNARTILMEDKGDGPASDTYFLQLLGGAPEHHAFRCEMLEGVDAVALSTDGLRYQATRFKDNYAAFPGFFEAWWRNVGKGMTSEELEARIEAIPVRLDVALDDKTLLLAVRSTGTPEVDWFNRVVNGSGSSSGSSSMPLPVPRAEREPEPSGGNPAPGATPSAPLASNAEIRDALVESGQHANLEGSDVVATTGRVAARALHAGATRPDRSIRDWVLDWWRGAEGDSRAPNCASEVSAAQPIHPAVSEPSTGSDELEPKRVVADVTPFRDSAPQPEVHKVEELANRREESD